LGGGFFFLGVCNGDRSVVLLVVACGCLWLLVVIVFACAVGTHCSFFFLASSSSFFFCFYLLPSSFFLLLLLPSSSFSQTLERAVFCFDGKDTVVNGKPKSKTSLLLSEVCPEVCPTTTTILPVRAGAVAAVSSTCFGRAHTPS
jgi:hypothetical protein